MKFDPGESKAELQRFAIGYSRSVDFDECSAINCLASHGRGLLNNGVECLLVGLTDQGCELLAKALKFLRASIETREIGPRYSQGTSEYLRLSEYTVARWLAGEGHDAESLTEAVRQQEIWFDREGSDRTNVDLSMADYVDAEEFAILIRRFEIARLNKPKNLKQIRGEGVMSYVIARQRLGLEYCPEQVTDALQSFLKRNVPQWLDSGHFSTAARWMKIVHWQPGDDPITTLLKCYDYLPGIEGPSSNPA